MKKTLICCLLTLTCFPLGAQPLGEDAFDMISISADEAREDEQPGILYFNGNFLMQSSDWKLTSEAAIVYGSPDKPDRVFLEGVPARFEVYRNDQSELGSIKATASAVEYIREANVLILSGGAMLELGDEVIRSTDIRYDISTNRYQAGGADGVLIKVPPINKS